MEKKFMDVVKDLLKNKKVVAGVSIGLAVVIATPILISVFNNDGPDGPNPGPGPSSKTYSNEDSTLVFSSGEFDKVFNPFFSTSAYDSSVVGQTQISMISSDDKGEKVVFGKDEPVVTLDYSEVMYDSTGAVTQMGDKNGTTVYQMVLKNDILFSDGQPLTANDVLFNMYVYLDPAYTGSSTMYSTDIVGLANYQMQQTGDITEGAQAALENTFGVLSGLRMATIVDYVDGKDSTNWQTSLANYNYQCALSGTDGTPMVQRKDENGNPVAYGEADILKDIEKIKTEWINEITTDWNAASADLVSMQTEYPFTKPWHLYFFNEGLISRKTEINATNGSTVYSKDANGKYIIEWEQYGYDPDAEYSKEEAIEEVKNAYLTDDTFVASILGGWATSGTISQLFAAEDKQLYYEARRAADGELQIKNIEGIKIKSGSEFKGTKKYDEDYSQYDMLEITINGVDPKAKWNFSFAVAPMHYYSTTELSNASLNDTNWATKSNFGVEFSSVDFMNALKRRNAVPMGAGIYQASTMWDYVYDWSNDAASFDKLSKEFCDSNVCYFIRNNNFVTTGGNRQAVYNATIKHVQYKVVNSANTMTSLQGGSIHYADPSATTDNINVIDNHSELKRIMSDTAGYGYIGINAKFVKNINVRRALMSAMDISLVQNYYPGTLSQPIYRSFSKTSWVYDSFEEDGVEVLEKWAPESRTFDGENDVDPEVEEQYYKYQKDPNGNKNTEKDLVKAQVKKYLDLGGCEFRNGKWYDSQEFGGELLKFTFTVAGDTTDHPAYKTFLNARDILNEMGLEIEVIPDSRALFKLASGNLAIWAAAWSSSLDPDMYQVYHKDSKATSILNWGYDYIKKSGTSEETTLIEDISALIDAGRETIVASERADIYRQASDLVMELAVELPVYQRSDMYVYNSTVLDASTFKKDITPFAGPLSEMWKVSFIEG